MKVRHFLLYGSLASKYGGPTYSVPIQCIGTQRLGIEMSFVVYEASRSYEERLSKEGVTMINIPDPPNKFYHSWAINVIRYLAKCSDFPDILHFHGVWMPANLWISKFGRKNQIPYVINPRGDLELTRINYDKIKKFKKNIAWRLYGKSIVENAACVIATSDQEKNSMRSLGCKVPIAIIPNGIELSSYPEKVIHAHRDKKIVLFLSRVNPIKGLELLIEAWNKLPDSLVANWELHIVGNSDPANYVCKLEEQIKNLGLVDSIKLLGPMTGDAKMQKYMNSDLFILPTFNENFGNVVAEAMMCECPAITTTNAPWKILKEDKCGWWIDLSIDNLVKTLLEAMSLTDEERIILGKKGRQSIINHFSAESVSKKTKEVYEWVLGMREKPDYVDV